VTCDRSLFVQPHQRHTLPTGARPVLSTLSSSSCSAAAPAPLPAPPFAAAAASAFAASMCADVACDESMLSKRHCFSASASASRASSACSSSMLTSCRKWRLRGWGWWCVVRRRAQGGDGVACQTTDGTRTLPRRPQLRSQQHRSTHESEQQQLACAPVLCDLLCRHAPDAADAAPLVLRAGGVGAASAVEEASAAQRVCPDLRLDSVVVAVINAVQRMVTRAVGRRGSVRRQRRRRGACAAAGAGRRVVCAARHHSRCRAIGCGSASRGSRSARRRRGVVAAAVDAAVRHFKRGRPVLLDHLHLQAAAAAAAAAANNTHTHTHTHTRAQR
jgi:hypothetical protein